MIKFLKGLSALLLLAAATAAALFWLPTGSWLVLPLARWIGSAMTPALRLEGVEGTLYRGYEVRGLALVSGDATYLTLDRAAVSLDWGLTLRGTPWVRSLEVQGLSADAEGLQELAGRWAGGGEGGRAAVHPLRASLRDLHLTLPQGTLDLSELTLTEEGDLALAALLRPRAENPAEDLPVALRGRLSFQPLEVLSSDLRVGGGRGVVRGRVLPDVDLRADLSALPLAPLMALAPDGAPSASGLLHGRLQVRTASGDVSAEGVLTLQKGAVADVPLSLRVPWHWAGGVLSVAGGELRTTASSVRLEASADLSRGVEALRVAARGDARNLSLREIGRIAAPDAGLEGEGGLVSFDLAGGLEKWEGRLAARLPEVSAAGRRLVRGLTLDARLRSGEAPRVSCGGEVFGGKLFGRGEVAEREGRLLPRLILSVVNADLSSAAAALPALAEHRLSGRATVTLRLAEDLSVSGRFASERLSAAGLDLSDLQADLRWRRGQASLDSLTARLGSASLSASGAANLGDRTLSLRAGLRDLDPRTFPQLAGQLRGLCDLEAAVEGSLEDPRATVRLRGRNNRAANVPLGNLDVTATYAAGRLSLPETRVSLPGGAVSLRGDVTFAPGSPRLDLSASVPALDLARLLKDLAPSVPVAGTVRGRLSVKGELQTASLQASLRAEGVRAWGVEVPTATLEAGGSAAQLSIRKLEARVGSALISGGGRVTAGKKRLADSALDVSVSVKGLALRPLAERFLEGAPLGGALDGSLALKGTLARPALTLRVDSPVSVNQVVIDAASLTLTSPSAGRYALTASGRKGGFALSMEGVLKRAGRAWAWAVRTEPMDLGALAAEVVPQAVGMVSGAATVSARGTAPGDGPIEVTVASRKLTAAGGVDVANVSLPITVLTGRGKVLMKEGSADLAGGVVRLSVEADLKGSRWKGRLTARDVDLGRLAAPFLTEGELVGSADLEADLKGNFGFLATSFAAGRFITSSGCLRGMDLIDAISPTKRISFEHVRGTFFWDGSDLFLNPGSQATAGPDEPLYRYFSVNGSLGIPGKGLKLVCKGRFDLKLLDQILGALKGVFQYMTGGLSGGLVRDALGRAIGLRGRDFQDVSFTLSNSWQELRLLNLKIDKPLQDYLPLDALNGNQRKQKDDTQFRLNLKFPTGPGGGSPEDRSTKDQLTEQLLDNLLHIGN